MVNVPRNCKFVAMMDKFVDTLNVTNITNGKQKRTPFQDPIHLASGFRLTVNNHKEHKQYLNVVAKRGVFTLLRQLGKECERFTDA